MNKFQWRVKKVMRYLANIRPDLPTKEIKKDARSTTKGIIRHIDRDFINKVW